MLKACKYIAIVISYLVPTTSEKLKPITEAMYYSAAQDSTIYGKRKSKVAHKIWRLSKRTNGNTGNQLCTKYSNISCGTPFRTIAK